MMIHTTAEVKGFLFRQTCSSLIKGVISTPQDKRCDKFVFYNSAHTSQTFFKSFSSQVKSTHAKIALDETLWMD